MSPEEQLEAALARCDCDRLSLEDFLMLLARLRDRRGQRLRLNPLPFIRLLPKLPEPSGRSRPGAPR